MQTTRTTKAAAITRTIKLEWNEREQAVEATVCEEHHKKTKSIVASFSCYFLRSIRADFGSALEVIKRFSEGEVYHIHTSNGVSQCDCPAGTYRGSCRHLEMVKEARKQGLL